MHSEESFKRKEKKKKDKKEKKQLSFEKLRESLEALIAVIETSTISRQEINFNLENIYEGELPEKMEEKLFQFLEEKATRKVGITEAGVLKKIMKGIRHQGWMENFRLKIIQDKLKKSTSK